MIKHLRLFSTLLLLAVASMAWGEEVTTSMDSFSAISGSVGGDQNIKYEAETGTASTAPGVYNNEVRVYQNGGLFRVTALNGVKIKSVILGSSMKTSVSYKADDGDESREFEINANETLSVSDLECTAILFTCKGTNKNSRLYVNYLSVTYATSGSTPVTTYTVSFDAGEGTFVGNTDFPAASNTKEAGTYTLPSATPATGYTFDGWLATGSTEAVTGSYTVSGDVAFTAQYTQNSSGGPQTATLTSSNLELTGSYTTNTEKTINGITYVFTDLMKNNDRIQAKEKTGTIKNVTPYPGDITSVVITHDGTARATTINGSADGENWTQVATGNGSITADFSGKGYKYFQITRGSNAAYWDKIEITYSETSLEQSDLTITNATTDLAFDLYNNTEAQVINYTTSSTGEVTISPAESDYFTISHDAANKQITVTPTAVTPGAQTVTIRQAADESYNAGAVTFTVNVTDSTPFEGSMFIFNTDEGLTELGIDKPASGKGTDLDEEAGYTKGIVTMSITHGGTTTTRVWNSNGSTDLRVYKDGGSLTFTVPAGNAITKVTFEGEAVNFDGLTGNVWTASGSAVNTVTFTNSATASKISTIKVEYEENNMPIINADDVNLAYDETSSSVTYTLTNDVEGGVMTAESSETWLTVGTPAEGSIALTCEANNETSERTATVTLTYTFNEGETVTKEVTVTQAAAPVVYATIPALFDAATSTETAVNVTFGGWVISAVSGSNAYLTDNEGHGLIIYKKNHGFNVGDVLTGTASCQLQVYKGSAELTQLTATTEGLTVTSGGSVETISNIAMSELGGVNTGVLVKYEKLTYKGSALEDAQGNTLTPYKSLYEGTFEEGALYTVTGIYVQFDETKEILPRSAADIVELIAVTFSENAKGKGTSGTAERYLATLYYGDKNLKMVGTNLGAYPVKVENGKIKNIVAYLSNRGDVIPAGTGVLLNAEEPGTYYFEVVGAPSYTAPSDNMLRGTDEAATTYAGEGKWKYYALSLNSSNTPGTAGFYFRQGCPNGEAFTNGAHKAYLAVPADVAGDAKSFTFGDDTDGIRQIENGELTIENSVVYDLSGRKLNEVSGRHGSLPLQLPKGIYIVNGKKVVVK